MAVHLGFVTAADLLRENYSKCFEEIEFKIQFLPRPFCMPVRKKEILNNGRRNVFNRNPNAT